MKKVGRKLGHIVSEETKKRISISLKGKFIGINNPNFGKKHSQETIEKIREGIKKNMPNTVFKKGMKSYKYWLNKKRLSITGENHYDWKGEKVGYGALHSWVKRQLGNPRECKSCGKTGLTGKKIHWANKDHSYKRNLKDWIRLCSNCHGKYDKAEGLRKHLIY